MRTWITWILWGFVLILLGFMVANAARGDTITLTNGQQFNGIVVDPHGFFLETPSETPLCIGRKHIRIKIQDTSNKVVGFIEIPASKVKSVKVNEKTTTETTLDEEGILLFAFLFPPPSLRINYRNYTETEKALDKVVSEGQSSERIKLDPQLFIFLKSERYADLRKAVVKELKLPHRSVHNF